MKYCSSSTKNHTGKYLDSVTLLGEFLEKNGKETPLCSII